MDISILSSYPSHVKKEAMSQALHDLDIASVLCHADERLTPEEALAFASEYYCTDAAEITERLALVSDLSRLTSAKDMQQGIDLIAAIDRESLKLSQTASRLGGALYRIRQLAAYVKAVDYWTAIFEGSSSPEAASERLQRLRHFFRTLSNAPSFAKGKEVLKEVDALLPLPRYIHLAMNLREDGYPTEMGILSAEGHVDLLSSSQEETPLNPFLSPEDVSKPSNSLGPSFTYHRDIYGSHFDEYFERALEKEWRSPLGKVEKVLDAFFKNTRPHPLSELPSLLSLLTPLSFYQTALLTAEAFMEKGYRLTLPQALAGAEALVIKNALYPDFILQHEGIQGNDLTLERGHGVVITGANHSGKTSYLKTIGQCYVLAQLGFMVPADSMTYQPLDGIYTLFSAGEDSSMSASRMGLEVKKLTAILQEVTPHDLVLLNEPMTSTNPVEAVSICGDISRHFLEKGVTHLLVTHLYDIYFLLKAQLHKDLLPKLESLVTESSFNEKSGQMEHAYRLYKHEPLGNSYARETATSYGITLPDMLTDTAALEKARQYIDNQKNESIYEGDDAHGLSDQS